MTRECTVCTRLMAIEQFRVYHTGPKAGKRLARCRQCESADRAVRKNPEVFVKPDPFASLMQSWRGPTNPPPLRSAV